MTEQPDGVLISIEHASKTFPGQKALSDVSFEIARAEIHALVGENGSGKSTLIKGLSGFHELDPGSSITVRGEPLTLGNPTESQRHGLRFVHQDLGLIGELSGAENIGLVSGFATTVTKRIDQRAQRRHARELLARIGVELDTDIPVSRLRAVDRSALAIARALDDAHGEIALLVLDEPTAALPPAECEALFRVLRDVVASGVSILYVSHRLDEVLGLASRVTVLRDGRCQGTLPTQGVDRLELARLIVGQEVEMQTSGEVVAARSASQQTLIVNRLDADTLHDVAFEIGEGEIIGVAGLSGSGRDALAGAVCGATDAEVDLVLHGRPVAGQMTPQLARELGFALVLPNRHPEAAIPAFTIAENMTLGRVPEFASLGRIKHAQERATVREWIERLDIRPPEPDRQYALLSGGNQQKVLLAKWLGMGPTVVFMEDPTSGVDIGARYAIYDLVRRYAETGIPFVVCSSDIEDFVGLCDRVIVLVEGRVAGELRGAAITEAELLRSISASAATI